MKYIKLCLVFFVSYVSPAEQVAQQKYISATVSISANRFKSLESAFKDVQSALVQAGLQVVPIRQKNYHMTLLGFNVEISQCLTQVQQDVLKNDIKKALGKAAHDGLKKSLQHLKKKKGSAHDPISLEFAYITPFKKKVVAIFEMSEVVQILINTIEAYFKNNIGYLINDGSITSIDKQQKILQPHVSLASITNQHIHFGARFSPKTIVKPFHIGKPVAQISVQLRDGVMPAPKSLNVTKVVPAVPELKPIYA